MAAASPLPMAEGGYFHEHSTIERYLQGNWNVLRGQASLRFPPWPPGGVPSRVHLAEGALVEPGAQVGPDVVVGRGSVVKAGANLTRVVIWPGATAEGELRDAIVTPRGVFQGGEHG